MKCNHAVITVSTRCKLRGNATRASASRHDDGSHQSNANQLERTLANRYPKCRFAGCTARQGLHKTFSAYDVTSHFLSTTCDRRCMSFDGSIHVHTFSPAETSIILSSASHISPSIPPVLDALLLTARGTRVHVSLGRDGGLASSVHKCIAVSRYISRWPHPRTVRSAESCCPAYVRINTFSVATVVEDTRLPYGHDPVAHKFSGCTRICSFRRAGSPDG